MKRPILRLPDPPPKKPPELLPWSPPRSLAGAPAYSPQSKPSGASMSPLYRAAYALLACFLAALCTTAAHTQSAACDVSDIVRRFDQAKARFAKSLVREWEAKLWQMDALQARLRSCGQAADYSASREQVQKVCDKVSRTRCQARLPAGADVQQTTRQGDGTTSMGRPGGGWKTAGGNNKKKGAASTGLTKGCLSLIDEPGYGGFKNSCDHDIELTYCIANFVVTPGAFNWGDAFACEKGKFGRVSVKAKGRSGNHTKGGRVYYVACKAPMGPIDVAYEKGRGLVGNCK